jgi:hypothetical protein
LTKGKECVRINIAVKVFHCGVEEMKPYEKEVIETLPNEYRPMGAWGYFWYSVLFLIPIIGWIALLICAFNNYSVPRRSFARSYFVVFFCITSVLLIVEIAALIWSRDYIFGILKQAKDIIFEWIDTNFGTQLH